MKNLVYNVLFFFMMSYDTYLRFNGCSIKTANREEAFYFLEQRGTIYCTSDYIGFWYPERVAFWGAIYCTKNTNDLSLPLKIRCQAVRKARFYWRQFLKLVNPYQPSVPSLPE